MKEQNNDNVPDKIAAINAWQDYNKNNNSIVVDLFQVCFMVYHVLFNKPFSSSEKESESNDFLIHFVEFSNVHNSGRSSNATRSNLAYKNV